MRPSRSSRRAFLTLAASAALTACAGPSPLPAFPGIARSQHKTRVAGLFGSQSFGGQDDHLTVLLQQAVDTLVAGGDKTLDPRLLWLPVPPSVPGGPGKPYTPGEVQALDILLNGSGTGASPAAAIPDLVALGSFVLQPAVAKHLLRPLDDLLKSTSLVQADDYYPGALAAARLDGHTYGLPLGLMPGMLQYDTTLFEEAGLEAPSAAWDWTRFLEACQKLTAPPRQYAFMPFGVPPLQLFIWQNGGDVLSKDGRHSTLDDPAVVEASGFYGDLFRQHKVVAPQASGATGYAFTGTQLTYNNARIALNFTTSPPPFAAPGGKRTLRLAEPFRARTQATTMQLQSLLTMTSRAADPPDDFAALVALATWLQSRSYLPPRRSLAKTADPAEAGFTLEADEAAGLLRAAEYARADTLDQTVGQVLFSKLQAPLQQGTTPAAQLCRDAAAAIDHLLQQAPGAAPATPAAAQ